MIDVSHASPETQARIAEKADANLPQGVAGAIFNVNSGKVLVLGLYGEVGTVIETQNNATKLVSNPTVGADVDLCATLEITADASGTIYNITGTLADAMVATTSGAMIAQANGVIVAAGTIDLDCAASNTGTTKWSCVYVPIDKGATVTSA